MCIRDRLYTSVYDFSLPLCVKHVHLSCVFIINLLTYLVLIPVLGRRMGHDDGVGLNSTNPISDYECTTTYVSAVTKTSTQPPNADQNHMSSRSSYSFTKHLPIKCQKFYKLSLSILGGFYQVNTC